MSISHTHSGPMCGRIRRRTFLADVGMGFTGLALGSMLRADGAARAEAATGGGSPDGNAHFAPKAKSVIWIFLSGGYSHLETFDPKPALNRLAGKTYDETELENPQKSPLFLARSRSVVDYLLSRLTVDVGSDVYNDLLAYAAAGVSWTGSDAQLQTKAPGVVHLILGSAEYQFV